MTGEKAEKDCERQKIQLGIVAKVPRLIPLHEKKENSWRIVAGVISFGAIGRTIDKRKVEILSQQNVVKYEIIINK